MSYEYFANDHKHIPEVEQVALRPLDERGEAKGETVEEVVALVHEGETEGLSGGVVGVDGETCRITLFVDTVPTEHRSKLEPHVVIERKADGTRWRVTIARHRLYGTRWVCDCRKERGLVS